MTALARCSERGCPTRYRGGPDRPCPLHAEDGGDTLAARMAAFADLAAVPGVRLDGSPGDSSDDEPSGHLFELVPWPGSPHTAGAPHDPIPQPR